MKTQISTPGSRFIEAISYGFVIALSAYLASFTEKLWRLKWFSAFHSSTQEIISITLYFFIVTSIFIFIAQSIKQNETNTYKRFSLSFYTFIFSYTLVVFYLFLISSFTFNPNFMIHIGLCGSLMILVVHLIKSLKYDSIISSFKQTILALFKQLFSLYGFLVFLLFVSLMVLAVGYAKSRSIADTITEIRLMFNRESSTPWILIPATGETKFRRPMIIQFDEQTPQTGYVLERSGKLFRIDYPNGSNKTLVLDITQKVGVIDVENGALGFDLHPEFSNSSSAHYGHIYLYYTSVHNEVQTNILSKFNIKKDLQKAIDSEEVLIHLSRDNTAYHNGGSVEFGTDGMLYIALGEGVRNDDYKAYSDTLRSAILRIDVNQDPNLSQPIQRQPKNGKTTGYSIPKDNPFIGHPKILDEYWAVGLRNPFRISFDKTTGALWAGDVGSDIWEEVNEIKKGGHYLFPYIEGPKTEDFKTPDDLIGQPQHATYAYEHSALERAVIGGIVYRGQSLPKLQGHYIFCDNFSGKLYGFDINQPQVSQVELIAQAPMGSQRGPTSIVADPEGNLLITLLGHNNKDTGQILKLVPRNEENLKKSTASQSEEESLAYNYDDTLSLFKESCARCHGANGQADGPDSKLFNVDIADFSSTDFQNKRSDKELENIIRKGGPANGLSPFMPPWESVLSDDEVKHLVKLIRTMKAE